MNLREFRENLDLHQSGAPICIGAATFYVRRSGTPEAAKMLKKISLSLFGPLHKYTDEDQSLKIAHFLVDYLVVKWENVYEECNENDSEYDKNYNGKILPYSQDAARNIFLNPEFYTSLNVQLWNASWEFENFLYDEMEASVEEIKK